MALEYWLLASWAARLCSTSASWFRACAASDAVCVPVDEDVPEAEDASAMLDAPRLAVPSDDVDPSALSVSAKSWARRLEVDCAPEPPELDAPWGLADAPTDVVGSVDPEDVEEPVEDKAAESKDPSTASKDSTSLKSAAVMLLADSEPEPPAPDALEDDPEDVAAPVDAEDPKDPEALPPTADLRSLSRSVRAVTAVLAALARVELSPCAPISDCKVLLANCEDELLSATRDVAEEVPWALFAAPPSKSCSIVEEDWVAPPAALEAAAPDVVVPFCVLSKL